MTDTPKPPNGTGKTPEANTKRSAKGGGKLSRSETVTVRLDPKLRYLAELAARKQRRTLSSYIEWAIEDSLKSVMLYQGTGYNGDESVSVAEEVSRLWDVDQAERFVRLAVFYPDLMSHEEQETWKLLQDTQLLQPAQSRRNGRLEWDTAILEDTVYPAVRHYWPRLMEAYQDTKPFTIEWAEQTKEEIADVQVHPKASSPRSPPLRAAPPPRSPPPTKSVFDDIDDDIPF
jgi:hypothetical protein